MTKWNGGKGSRDRTKDKDKYAESFEKIFGKRENDNKNKKGVKKDGK